VLNRFISVVNKASDSLRLNSEVAKITPNGEGGAIKVVLTNEQELTADYVIVTVSLAVLKAKAAEMFSPALSANKMEAIEKVGIGSNAKVG
jgi:monoamine oxidase